MKCVNPIDPGCYADPEARFYEGKYYIYVTRSLPFKDQMNQDCFVSEDLVSFQKVGKASAIIHMLKANRTACPDRKTISLTIIP